MGRFVQSVTGAVFILVLAGICAGCGGGAVAVVQQPQAADFSVAVSSSAVSISQGGVSVPVSFSITAHNGFSANIQVTFAGLPGGVSSNPASPFTMTSGVDTAVNFGAAATASTGSFTLSAQAVSGALSHSASLTLAIQASSAVGGIAGFAISGPSRVAATSAQTVFIGLSTERLRCKPLAPPRFGIPACTSRPCRRAKN